MSHAASLACTPLPLDRRFAWVVSPGAQGAPVVHKLVSMSLVASGAACLSWWLAWLADAAMGRTSFWAAAWSSLVALPCAAFLCWLWQRWHVQVEPMTLHWEGLPRREHPREVPSDFVLKQGWQGDEPRAGWWVSPWRCPVQLSVILDLQRHVLIKLVPLDAVDAVSPCWVWLDLVAVQRRHDASEHPGAHWASAHTLRVCLNMRVARRVAALAGPNADLVGKPSKGRRSVASSDPEPNASQSTGHTLSRIQDHNRAAQMVMRMHADFEDTVIDSSQASPLPGTRIQCPKGAA